MQRWQDCAEPGGQARRCPSSAKAVATYEDLKATRRRRTIIEVIFGKLCRLRLIWIESSLCGGTESGGFSRWSGCTGAAAGGDTSIALAALLFCATPSSTGVDRIGDGSGAGGRLVAVVVSVSDTTSGASWPS